MSTRRLMRLMGPALAVFAAAAAIGWYPARQAEDRAEGRIDAAESLTGDLNSELTTASETVATESDLRAELTQLSALVPADHEVPETVIALEALSGDLGVELTDVLPASVLGPADDLRTPIGTSSIVMSIGLQASFADLVSFLDRLASEPRLHVVDSLAIGTEETEGQLAADLEVRVFTTRALVPDEDDGFSDDEFGDDEVDDEVDAGPADPLTLGDGVGLVTTTLEETG